MPASDLFSGEAPPPDTPPRATPAQIASGHAPTRAPLFGNRFTPAILLPALPGTGDQSPVGPVVRSARLHTSFTHARTRAPLSGDRFTPAILLPTLSGAGDQSPVGAVIRFTVHKRSFWQIRLFFGRFGSFLADSGPYSVPCCFKISLDMSENQNTLNTDSNSVSMA